MIIYLLSGILLTLLYGLYKIMQIKYYLGMIYLNNACAHKWCLENYQNYPRHKEILETEELNV